MRIERVEPKLVISHVCPDHSARSPEYDFEDVRRTKHSISHDVAWGGME